MSAPASGTAPLDAGVLMVKPGVVLTDDARRELGERVGAAGYVIADERVIDATIVRDGGLIRRHYHDHFEVARAGRLLPDEWARLIAIYDRPAFAAITGRPFASDAVHPAIEVVPAIALAARCGIELATIARWAERGAAAHGIDTGEVLACNEVGELADVQLLVDPRELGAPVEVAVPLLVLNPQMASLARWWEDDGDPTAVFRLHAAAGAWPWAKMRRSFLGTGPPATWPRGSLRGDLLARRSALRYRDGITMGVARNGAHLSNGPIEALREVCVWFGDEPHETSIGRALVTAGIDPVALLEAVYVDGPTGTAAIASRTEHLALPDAITILRGARLLRADEIGEPVTPRDP